jgi:hypothetical protein
LISKNVAKTVSFSGLTSGTKWLRAKAKGSSDHDCGLMSGAFEKVYPIGKEGFHAKLLTKLFVLGIPIEH